MTPPVSNLTTLQIWFSDFQVYLLTLPIDPPPPPLVVNPSVSVHCVCKGISKDLLWTAINRYLISTSKDLLGRKWHNKFYFTATCSAMAGVYIYREREYWTVRFTPPHPPLELWSKSRKWYTALHSMQLYISVVTVCIVSFGVEQVDRSVMHFFLWQISVNFFMISSSCCCCCCVLHHNIYMLLLLLLLLCMTHQEQ